MWFNGHFDPLLAEHARLLHEAKGSAEVLAVEITNSANPLLAQRARAELVAGLADVDYVVLVNGTADESPDARLTQRLMEHVRQRSNGASA